jgi:hypothetical protein
MMIFFEIIIVCQFYAARQQETIPNLSSSLNKTPSQLIIKKKTFSKFGHRMPEVSTIS